MRRRFRRSRENDQNVVNLGQICENLSRWGLAALTGSSFISKKLVASATFMLYTRKINPIFSDVQNRIFDFEVAALDMMHFEWSYIFPRSRINLSFFVSFFFLGDIGETKLIREATLKGHISSSRRGIPVLSIGLEPPWSQLDLGSIKRLGCVHMPGVARDNGQQGRK